MNEQFESVWDAIEDTPAEAEKMKLRSQLMMQLTRHIKESRLNQTEAARLFGVTQPRISDLMRGKINLFSIDSLTDMAAAAGLHIELRLRKAA
jgi:predicted XRE-type DNA-binding protein